MKHGAMAISAVVSLLAISQAVQAGVIANVQFSKGTAYTGAAVVGASGDYWNVYSNGSVWQSSLKGTNGVSGNISLTYWSTVGVTGILPEYTSGFAGTPYETLMQGYLRSQDRRVAFDGLNPFTAYDLYVYTQGDLTTNRNKTTFMGLTDTGWVNLVTTTPTDPGASTFILNQNYVKLSLTTDKDGQATFVYSAQDDYGANAACINGMQLATVPEPATMSLLALGGLALLKRRRTTAAGRS